jgi:hypothetical protein
MAGSASPSPAASSTGVGPFLGGLAIGAIGGLVLGYALRGGGTLFAGPLSTAHSAAATTTSATASAASSQGPSSNPFPVTIGRAREEFGSVEIPVVLRNESGQDASYVEVNCSFYAKDGSLLSSGMANTVNMAAGAQDNTEMIVQGLTLSEVDHYECSTRGG